MLLFYTSPEAYTIIGMVSGKIVYGVLWALDSIVNTRQTVLHGIISLTSTALPQWIPQNYLDAPTLPWYPLFQILLTKVVVLTVITTTFSGWLPRKNVPPRNTPDHFAADSPDKIIAALRGRYFSFLQIKSYVVVQISENRFGLLTAQLQSVIIAFERSKT